MARFNSSAFRILLQGISWRNFPRLVTITYPPSFRQTANRLPDGSEVDHSLLDHSVCASSITEEMEVLMLMMWWEQRIYHSGEKAQKTTSEYTRHFCTGMFGLQEHKLEKNGGDIPPGGWNDSMSLLFTESHRPWLRWPRQSRYLLQKKRIWYLR